MNVAAQTERPNPAILAEAALRTKVPGDKKDDALAASGTAQSIDFSELIDADSSAEEDADAAVTNISVPLPATRIARGAGSVISPLIANGSNSLGLDVILVPTPVEFAPGGVNHGKQHVANHGTCERQDSEETAKFESNLPITGLSVTMDVNLNDFTSHDYFERPTKTQVAAEQSVLAAFGNSSPSIEQSKHIAEQSCQTGILTNDPGLGDKIVTYAIANSLGTETNISSQSMVEIAQTPIALTESIRIPVPEPVLSQQVKTFSFTEESRLANLVGAAIVRSHENTIEIRIDPPELGKIKIEIELTGSNIRASIIAENFDVADLLRRNSDILVRELNASGFDRVSLDFGSENSQTRHRHTQDFESVTLIDDISSNRAEGGTDDDGLPQFDRRSARGSLDIRF